MRSGMFTSVNGDRKYTSEFFAEYFASFIGNGVFPNPSDNLQVMANTGLDIAVQSGRAWIDGYILFNDSDEPLTLDAADARLGRIDKVVIRWDKIERVITLGIKKGTPATEPVTPGLQRDEDFHELGIADIRVGANAAAITQSSITDLRLNSEQCGIVKGVVEQIDTTTLMNQYQAWMNEKKVEYDADLINFTSTKKQEIENLKTGYDTDLNDYVVLKKQEWSDWYSTNTSAFTEEFNTWFAGIKDILDGNTAGNLLNLIENIRKTYVGTVESDEIKTGDIWHRELS